MPNLPSSKQDIAFISAGTNTILSSQNRGLTIGNSHRSYQGIRHLRRFADTTTPTPTIRMTCMTRQDLADILEEALAIGNSVAALRCTSNEDSKSALPKTSKHQ